MTSSTNERTPNTSRSLRSLNALGISTTGVRTTKVTGQRALAELPPPTPPASLEQLEAIGYRHGAARAVAELRTIAELGWIDLDHLIATELARAMRAAARSMNGLSMALAPPEARRLAYGAALARIDVLRAQSARPNDTDDRATFTRLSASAGAHRGFHGGC